MPLYRYQARDNDGAAITGEVEAVSADELKENLFRNGMIPVEVREVGGSFSWDALGSLFNRVKDEDMMIFVRQFYTLFRAGVSMDTIMSTLSRQISGKALRNAITRIRADIASGSTLAQAFGKHPAVFNEFFVAMLAAGEEAGILESVLQQLAQLLEKEFEIKKSVKGAVLYPKIIVVVLVSAIVFLLSFVVPKFVGFYAKYGADLPLPTKILIGASQVVKGYWYVVLIVVGIAYFLYRRYAATNVGRYKIDRLRFNMPVFGPLQLKIASARFGHIMAALYRSGLSMPRSLEVVADVIGNQAFALEVRKIRDDIQKGSTLSEAMQRHQYFPPVVVETTMVGEKSGTLDEMMSTVADHFDLEVAHTIKNLTTLLEPLLLIAIFGIVLLVALAIFLPIWNLSRVVSGR